MSSFSRAELLSQCVSTQIRSTVQRETEELEEDSEINNLSRGFYLNVVDNPEWKTQLLDVISQVKDTVQYELDAIKESNEDGDENVNEDGKDYTLYVGSNGITGEFNIGDCFIIGTKTGTDITCSSACVSRVHAFVFVTSTKIVVLDYFSLGGTVCESRSGSGILPKSTNTHGRRPMVFDLSEAFTIKLANNVTVKFSTRHCVVCLAAPREMRFVDCNHGVVCSACENIVTHCPVCRVLTRRNVIASHCMKTYVS